MPVPSEIRTSRLLMRPWRAEHAARLHPVLQAHHAHLAPWIPARIADPATVPLLEERLAGFAADFAAAREWRYGLFPPDESRVLGEVALFRYRTRHAFRSPMPTAWKSATGFART